MVSSIDVTLFFNFRSPYCYLASKTLWPIIDDFNTRLNWRPVGGWDLRSSPDRVKQKLPLARQDIARFARRFQMPLSPPPKDTDPTRAGAASLYAEEKGMLRPYLIAVMNAEWAEGKDIGDLDVLRDIATKIGLPADEVVSAAEDDRYLKQLQLNAEEAAQVGVIGVPSFVIGEQIFWGQDRIDFVIEELQMLSSGQRDV
jgi:2-hydroxychromene-2-carboxylate isomerase